MADRDQRLLDLAHAIADGAAVDWESIEAMSVSDSERAQIRHLRLIGDVAGSASTFDSSATASQHESLLHPADQDQTSSDTTPVTWGPLQVIEKIGRGRFGDVYRASDPRLDRDVALKLLRRRSDGDNLGSAVIHEGRLLAKVRHPAVVTVYGAERIDGRVGVWMELIRGETLEQELVRRGPFSESEIVQIGVDLCRALGAVHRAGLLHRDIKAQNVMRDADGRLVLMDFGTGRELESTSTFELAGTPLYLAPEVLRGEPATAQSDIYSVGVLLFHLATGQFPVAGRTLMEIRDGHKLDLAPGAFTNLPLSAPLREAIARALSPVAETRFTRAEELEEALLSGSVAPALPAHRRSMAAVATIGVAATAIAIVVAAVNPFSDPDGPVRRLEGLVKPETSASREAISGTAPAAPGVTAGTKPGEPNPVEGPVRSGRAVALTVPALIHLNPQLQTTMSLPGAAFSQRWMACRSDRGDVSLCDLETGEVRVIRAATPNSVAAVGRHSMLLSPDGSRIAYRLNEGPPNQLHRVSLRVIGKDSTGDTEVFRGNPTAPPRMHRWLPDGSAVLASAVEGSGLLVFLVPVGGSAHKELIRLPSGAGPFPDLSPDAKLLAVTRDAGQGNGDLVIIELEGGRETKVVEALPRLAFPLWTPDGRAIVFTTFRGGGSVLMRQLVSAGTAVGPPEIVWRFGRSDVRLADFGADGSLFAIYRAGLRTAYRAPIDLSRSFVGTAQLVDPIDAEDTIGADWSPDGTQVAYLRGLLGRPDGPAGTVVIRTVGGSIIAEIPLPRWMPETGTQLRWSPDGRRLAVAYGGETPTAIAIDVIDIDTQERRPVVSGIPVESPRWGASGEWLYYQQASAIVRVNLSTKLTEQVYRAEGFGLQRNAGFDVSRIDGAFAVVATRRGEPGCLIRIVESSGQIVDRQAFVDTCRAVAWSHEGSRILVSTVPDGKPPSLWSLDRHVGEPVRLPIEAPVFHDLSLDSAGRHLLFSTGNPPFTKVMITGIQSAGR